MMDRARGGFLDRVLSSALCGIYVYNLAEGTNEFINAEYTRITGWTLEELNALPAEAFAELFHPHERGAVFAHIEELQRSDDALDIDYRFRTKDGRWIWCLSRDAAFERAEDGTLRRFIGTFIDVTERKQRAERQAQMQERMVQSQRLESLGVLAGGIAHDFNNLLMVISGNAEMVESRLSGHSENVSAILTATQEAADLCRQMLAYAGQGSYRTLALSLDGVIQEARPMLKTSLAKGCALELDLSGEEATIRGDPAQMTQVVMNLVRNASEACGDGPCRVTVSTRVQQVTPEMAEPGDLLVSSPGRTVCLTVTDTGAGMDADTLGRACEPFFSTKFVGRGLGLSSVVGIVRSHQGGLRIETEVGRGTTVRVWFPAIDDRPTGTPGAPQEAGVVLVADDEPGVLRICSQFLAHLGFRVLTAADGLEAVELFAQDPSAIDVVLLDLTMPKLCGDEAFRRMRQVDPQAKVVLATGFGLRDLEADLGAEGVSAFLKKPYSLADLRRVVTRLCSESSG